MRSALFTALALLASASIAHAQPFITPGLEPPNAGLLDCRVVNGGEKPIDFVRRIYDFNGNVVVNPQGFLSNLGAHASSVTSSNDDDARYCVVDMKSGGRNKVRITLSTRDAVGTALLAVEGR
jgi:hypothetical protein